MRERLQTMDLVAPIRDLVIQGKSLLYKPDHSTCKMDFGNLVSAVNDWETYRHLADKQDMRQPKISVDDIDNSKYPVDEISIVLEVLQDSGHVTSNYFT
jgi:hypothetical protein